MGSGLCALHGLDLWPQAGFGGVALALQATGSATAALHIPSPSGVVGPPIGVVLVQAAGVTLATGVPLGEAALRLGHSVETLVSYYVGALQGDDELANQKISEALKVAGLDQ